ncbi:MAG TPA: sugar ABC transporter ATP-binding protein [Spirochaetia bacterium]|nr:sugar ABC transporter ATP-binding protein [Spirochaetia bacterium]
MDTVPILEAHQVRKRYPGVQALDGVDFRLEAGEVRALIGKNGAGKSTFVKILSGATHPDSGTLTVQGRPTVIHSPADAFAAGIATVYQEMSLVMGLSVAENILLGRWPRSRRLGMPTIDTRRTVAEAREALDLMGVSLNPREQVRRLSVPQRQMVEIAKAISFKPKVLILDEPTSSLPAHEVDALLALVRRLADRGVAVIYVSHRLQELPRVADSLTVFRDGLQVGTIPMPEATPERIVQMMIGSEWKRSSSTTRGATGAVRLSVKDAFRKRFIRGVSFDLHEGEVLGIAGLLGSGRTELLRAIFGLDRLDSGSIIVNGRTVRRPTPIRMKSLGVGMTPEDRKGEGIVAALSVAKNLTLTSLDRISRARVISPRAERDLAGGMVKALSIRTPNTAVQARALSGGNQQKLVIGKWLNSQVQVLLMDEPTRGIDIEAKNQVYGLVRELAARGISIVFVSSEIEEVLEVSDRILVFNRGRIAADLPIGQATLEKVLAISMVDEEQAAV